MSRFNTLCQSAMAVLLASSLISCSQKTPNPAGESVPPPHVAASFSGVWKTSYGDVYFPKYTGSAVRGAFWSYPQSNGRADNGRIIAEIEGNVLRGYWIEDSGDYPCDTERDGSRNWGPVHFEANEDFSIISGAWGVCEQQAQGDDAGWVGVRD